MSLNNTETPLLHRFWKETGGTLIEEFFVVAKARDCMARRIDGVIVLGGEFSMVKQSEVSIAGKDVVCVQVKSGALGMSLMGQAFFSKLLLERLEEPPKSVKSVAIASKGDRVLQELFEEHEGCQAVIYEHGPP